MNVPSWLIQNGLIVAVLLPAVWILSWVFHWRPACQHWLWLLLLAKLVLPPLILWPFPFAALQRLDSESVERHPINISHTPRHPRTAEARSEDETANLNEQEISPAPTESEYRPANAFPPLTTATVVPFLQVVWLLGSIVAAVLAGRTVLTTYRLVRKSRPPTSALKAAVEHVGQRFGSRKVAIRVSKFIESPSIVALFPPVLIWPENLTEGEFEKKYEPVMAHELAHLQRGDHWVAWLELVTRIVWWWNPVYWVICRQLHESRELACDALALRITDGSPREYATQLLEMTTLKNQPSLYGLGAVSSFSLRTRLKMLFEERLSGRTSVSGWLLISFLAIALAPAWSRGENEPQPEQQSQNAESTAVDERQQPEILQAPTDQKAVAQETQSAPASTPVAKSTKLVRLSGMIGLIINDSVLRELGIEKGSAEQTEIRKLANFAEELQKRTNAPTEEDRAEKLTGRELYAKVEAEQVAKLKQYLKREQFTRWRQIHLQQLGMQSINDSEVAKELGISEEQQEKLAAVDREIADRRKELEKEKKELRDASQDTDEIQKQIEGIDELRSEKYNDVLTPQQRTKFAQMQGVPFALEKPKPRASSARPGMPIGTFRGGMMLIAVQEPVLKELGISKDAPEVAEIRKLSDVYASDLRQELKGPDDNNRLREIEAKIQAKHNPDLKKWLTVEQFDRLQQIYWQFMRAEALSDPVVIQALELSKDQQEKIYAAKYEQFVAQRNLLNPSEGRIVGTSISEETGNKIQESITERDQKINQILTADQQSKFTAMKGKPFDLTSLRSALSGRARPSTDE